MTPDDLAKILTKPGYSVVDAGLPRNQPKPQQRAKQVGNEVPAQKGGSRPVVIVTRCSTGSLDRDNLGASAKAIVDALRHHGYIAGDRECDIDLITLQRKVKRGEIGTLIEILHPSCP